MNEFKNSRIKPKAPDSGKLSTGTQWKKKKYKEIICV